ncbi:MAG: TolC family protein, partial [Myxococcales bacterium]|nr:TolC family protein [Myxococcales bacterium]
RDLRLLALRREELSALSSLLREKANLFRDVAEHQERVMAYGPADYQDVLRVSIQADLLEDRIADLELERDELAVSLSALVFPERVPELDWSSWDLVRLGDIELPSQEALMAAVDRHPEIERVRAMQRGAQASAEDALVQRTPGLTFSASWSIIEPYDMPMAGTGDGGRDVFMLGVSLPLPIVAAPYRYRAAHFEELGQAAAAEAGNARRRAEEEMRRRLLSIATEQARLERFNRDLVPLAHDITEQLQVELSHGAEEHTDYLLAVQQELLLQEQLIQSEYQIAREVIYIDYLSAGALLSGGVQ